MLSDKVCIVAGGGHGIGEATAIELGERGAAVVVNDLGTSLEGEGESEEPAEETAAAIREAGGRAMAHFGDVTSLEYTESLVEDAVAEYGDLHGVVNFAGITRDSICYKMDGETWDSVVNVHLRGHFSLLRHAASYWRDVARDHDDGLDPQRSFLGVSSPAAMGNFGQSNYTAAKAGVLGLVRTAAIELHDHGVRVNALMPAAFTRMIEEMPEGVRPDEAEMPDPEDVAPMVSYLLSDEARDITGCTVLARGEEVGLVSNPEIRHTETKAGGWTAEDLAAEFRETVAADADLTRNERTF